MEGVLRASPTVLAREWSAIDFTLIKLSILQSPSMGVGGCSAPSNMIIGNLYDNGRDGC